jgi:dTDP-4-dehydrorhamnose 3,5-epimerase
MIYGATELAGVHLLDMERLEDERGFFARAWCEEDFAAHGLSGRFVQSSVSFNKRRGTLRGLHYQAAPAAETKLVRCTLGAIHDVLLDLRPGSPTFKRWIGVELSAENRRALYVPEGIAHGFQTLEDRSEVLYHMGTRHSPAHARGVRWDDPAFAIPWPLPVSCISERDARYPDFGFTP